MRYNKQIDNGYILTIGTGYGNTEITAEEYAELLAMIQSRPTPREGYDYRLREDLTWEEYELPPFEPTDDEISDEEALAIILGGGA